MRDLLLEIGVEELPARFILPAVKQLGELLETQLAAQRITFNEIQLFSTPRRLAVKVIGVALLQLDLEQEVKGPPKSIAFQDGVPTKAALGFARSQELEIDQLIVKELGGAEYLFAPKFQKGQPTKEVLTNILPEIITGLSFAKNMRWGNSQLRYARPLRWIVAMLGQEIVPCSVGNVASDNLTYGHRQLSTGPIVLTSASQYPHLLEESYVIVDYKQRRQRISQQIQALAKQSQAQVLTDEDLLTEVTNLVEYPTAFLGSFAQEYLAVPNDVLITSMKEHQRYFPLFDTQNQLLPAFIGVRNGADNHLHLVTAGNEKVLRARLSDAKFFFDEDRNQPLEDNVEKLKSVVFQEGLGTVYDKVERIQNLTKKLCDVLGYAEQKLACERTARLAKADLVSHMVYEFPELQGIMGAEYAQLAGEETLIVRGIVDHYKPRFAGDQLPESISGIIVGLADKLDSLVGYFGLGKIPTGSQDPFALRRQAQGIVAILWHKQLNGQLKQIIDLAIAGYETLFAEKSDELAVQVLEFLRGRIRVMFLDQGFRYDEVDAVLAGNCDQIPGLHQRVAVLNEFRTSKEFKDLLTAFERCSNLASKSTRTVIDKSLLTSEDSAFKSVIDDVRTQCLQLLEAHRYQEYLATLAKTRPAIDAYFKAVMIMDKEEKVRQNRLELLHEVVDLFIQYADFRMIVIDM